ncbi:MAG: DUF2853 family protein [Bacteroidota bacterium]
MSSHTYESEISHLREDLDKLGIHYHEGLIDAIISYLEPAIHNADAALVACSDKTELATIKNNFLKGKLGLEDEEAMDKAIMEVCHHLGESNNKKHRATFYYLLVGLFKKEELFLASK